jgi:hypothetical protein
MRTVDGFSRKLASTSLPSAPMARRVTTSDPERRPSTAAYSIRRSAAALPTRSDLSEYVTYLMWRKVGLHRRRASR